VHHHSDTPAVPPSSGSRRRRGPAPRGRGRPGSRWLAWAGVLGGLLLVVAAAVTAPAVAAAPAAGDWPQFGRTAQHPNTNPAETAFTPANVGGLAVAWTGQFGEADETGAGPVVAGGSVYVTGFDGNLSVFDAAGCGASACKLRWQGHTGNDITSSAAVADGLVLVGSADHLLYAFPADGCGAAVCEPLWTGVNFADGFESSPVVAGNVAFVAKGPASGFPVDAGVYAFDVRGCGKRICQPRAFVQLSTSQSYQGSSIAVSGGKVLLNSTDNTVTPDAPAQTNLYVLALQ
jgi:hypothetical protein